MFFTLQELGQWLGVTAYEIMIWVTSVTIFSILLCIKCDSSYSEMSWWTVFSPLFVGDGLNAYFVTTLFIRMYVDKKVKPAMLRVLWSLSQLFLVFLFEFLLCWKLSEPNHFEYSEVTAPLFLLSLFIMVRACQLH